MTLALVHLVWAPLGQDPVREFLRSYRQHPAGIEHDLVLVLNGAGTTPAVDLLPVELVDVEHRLIVLQRPVLDLDAYLETAARLRHANVCFLNSYAVALADGWLASLAAALAPPDVGLVGASGSWESQAEWRRGALRHRPQQLLRLARERRDFPRFPNPHIRTSSFALARDLLLGVGLERSVDKRTTYLHESGRRSITRRVQAAGLQTLVAGRDGRAYDVEEWPESRTFRSGRQENLLVADNQTRDYEHASARRRRRLARDSWGSRAVAG